MQRILFLGLILSILSCKAQYKSYVGEQSKIIKMAKLDNKSFDEIKINGEANFTLPNGNSVRQISMRDTYVEDIKTKSNPFKTQNVYAKSDGAIQSSVKVFYGFPIGVKKFYDSNGNIIKEIDYDQPFQFSIYDLATKIKNEFNIDIMSGHNNIFINRGTEPPQYDVSFPANLNFNSFNADSRRLLIDGNTGKILSNTILRHNE